MTDQPKLPLWRVMDWYACAEAYGFEPDDPIDCAAQDRCCGGRIRIEYAAEIRALVDWLDQHYDGADRRDLRDILLNEADRAEAWE